MLTPEFEVDQDENRVSIVLRVPYVNPDAMTYDVCGAEFRFYASPYFLRLIFPHELAADRGRDTAPSFDFGSLRVTFGIAKAVPGQHFEDLALLSSLLAKRPRAAAPRGPLISEVPGVGGDAEALRGSQDERDEEEEGYDWEQELGPSRDDAAVRFLQAGGGFGFGRRFSDYFLHVTEDEAAMVVDLPEVTAAAGPADPTARRELRIASEDAKFDEDHYMANFILDKEIQWVLAYVPAHTQHAAELERLVPVKTSEMVKKGALGERERATDQKDCDLGSSLQQLDIKKDGPKRDFLLSEVSTRLLCEADEDHQQREIASIQEGAGADTNELRRKRSRQLVEEALVRERVACSLVHFEAEERDVLRVLGNREYLLDASAARGALLSLVSVVYSWCYDMRTTSGEGSVESAWTIRKLAAPLVWLDEPLSARDALLTCVTRTLAYPLFRHWELARRVCQDAACVFALGRRMLVKVLLDVRRKFRESEPCFRLNTLFVDDAVVWIQSVSPAHVRSLAERLERTRIRKGDVRFPLALLEKEARELDWNPCA